MKHKKEYHYKYITIILHLIVAISLITSMGLGYWAISFQSSSAPTLLMWHRSFGLIGMVVSLMMLLVRLFGKPRPKLHLSLMLDTIRKVVHVLLYTLPTLVFISGILIFAYKNESITFFYVVTIPAFAQAHVVYQALFSSVHFWLNLLFLGVIGAHVLAVIYHLLHKPRILYRMFPFKILLRKKKSVSHCNKN